MGVVIVLGSTMKTGGTEAKDPITRKILRRHDKRKLPASASETAVLKQQEKDEKEKEKRTLKTQEFKDMPLKVHVVRNLDSDTWHQDLQIEVKNIGTKPIYSILAYLLFPEHKAPGNRDTGIILRFGERKYIDIRAIGDPQDPHLNPGDTYVFTTLPQYRKGIKIQHEKAADEFKRLELHFDLISFGDGTGFEVGDFTDHRSKTSHFVTSENHEFTACN